jgi:MFS family permease
MLAVLTALQFGPSVLFSLFGGALADRVDRRRILMSVQCGMAVLALMLAIAVATGAVRVWVILACAVPFGILKSFEGPTQYAFIRDLVDEPELPNSIALNNVVIASGRMIGPATGGLVFAALGAGFGFLLSALATALAVSVLLTLHTRRPVRAKPAARSGGEIREGLHYIFTNKVLLSTVLVMTSVFVSTYNFQVLFPLLASQVLNGGSALFGQLMSALGFGAVVGSLMIASRVKTGVRRVAIWAGALAAVQILLATCDNAIFAIGEAFLFGVAVSSFNVTVSSTLQVHTRPDMTGRVMSVYTMAILGSSVVGGPPIGFIADRAGVHAAFLAAGLACASVSLLAIMISRRIENTTAEKTNSHDGHPL